MEEKYMHHDQKALFEYFIEFQNYGAEDGHPCGVEVTEEDLLEAWRTAKKQTKYFTFPLIQNE